MIISGSFETLSGYENAINFLGNIDNIISCMPMYDVKKDGIIKAKIKIDLSFLNMDALKSITGKISFNYIVNDNNITVDGSGRAAGAGLKFKIDIKINKDKNTIILWNADFDPGIIAKMLGKNKLDEAASVNIENAIKCIKARLDDLHH